VKLTTHLHLVPRLRICGPIPPLLQYTFMECSLYLTASRQALKPTQPPVQWVTGPRSLGVEPPGCEADHSPPSSAKVKNAWSYTSTPSYVYIRILQFGVYVFEMQSVGFCFPRCSSYSFIADKKSTVVKALQQQRYKVYCVGIQITFLSISSSAVQPEGSTSVVQRFDQ